MQALHFGAGNIGRGFIGKLLSHSGFHVIFSDINTSLIEAINYYKKYRIKLVEKNKEQYIDIKNISAVHVNDPTVLKSIALVDVITTAVGFNILEKISEKIAQGIILKINLQSNTYLNIIACENKTLASSCLKKMVLNHLPLKYHEYVKKYVGFVDCSVDKIIPILPVNTKDILFVLTEFFEEWIVNSMQFKGIRPKIIGMTCSKNLISFSERKLLTLNTGHAVAAYLGLIKKYKTIQESILDEKIQNIVRKSMEESGNVLIKRYNFNQKEHFSYIDSIFFRFSNPCIIDSLERIARNPLQKLEKKGRLINPFLGAIDYGLPFFNLIKGIASVLYYKNAFDVESIKMQNLIKKEGIHKALSIISQLNIDSLEINYILKEYKMLFKVLF